MHTRNPETLCNITFYHSITIPNRFDHQNLFQICPLFFPISVGITSTQPASLTWTTVIVFKMMSLLIRLSASIHYKHNPDHSIICCLKPFKVYHCTHMKWALSYLSSPVPSPLVSVLSTQHCQVSRSLWLRNQAVTWRATVTWDCFLEANLIWMEMRLNLLLQAVFLRKILHFKGKPFSFNIIAFSRPYKIAHQNQISSSGCLYSFAVL